MFYIFIHSTVERQRIFESWFSFRILDFFDLLILGFLCKDLVPSA